MIEIHWDFVGARKPNCKMPTEKRQSWLLVWKQFAISSPSHLVRLFSFQHWYTTPLCSDFFFLLPLICSYLLLSLSKHPSKLYKNTPSFTDVEEQTNKKKG